MCLSGRCSMCQHAAVDRKEAKRVVSVLEVPPKGHHYNPYTRQWAPNLTEAQVQSMWPYAMKPSPKKQEPKVDPIHDWMEETLQIAGLDKTQPDTLTEVPPPSVTPKQLELELVGGMVNNMLSSADMVTLPKHYARFEIEPIRFICQNNLNFFQGNIIKYVLRHDAKNGLEDLKKARRYLDMFIKFVEGNPDWWRKD